MKQRYGYGYVRVSTDKQDELSPDSQEKLLKDYAGKNNIVLLSIFFEIGISGRKAKKRPQFQKMIASAKSREHPVDVILVWKFSRFARNQEESIVYKSLLKKQNNVDVISVSEPLVEGPFGSLIERIIEWMDEYYSIRLSSEVTRGMTEKALRGGYQARPPLGYKIQDKGKPPVIVPDEAKIVKLIFDKYVNEKRELFDIARYLNSLGYKTSQNKPFERRSLEYIIQNPTYCGMIRWNRTTNETNEIKPPSEWIIAEGEHEALISKELFQAAQARYNSTSKKKGTRPSSTYRHWLSGLLKCPECGRTLTASTMHQANGNPYSYFSCYGYHKGKCKHPNGVSSLVIEIEILKSIKEVLDSDDLLFEYKKSIPLETVDECEVLEKRLNSLLDKEKRIKASYRNGIDTLEEYRENKILIQKEKDSILNQISLLKTGNTEDRIADDKRLFFKKIHNVHDILSTHQYTDVQKNTALKQIIDKIIYIRNKDTLIVYYRYPS